MGKLDGRVAIITGASRGIGEEIAKLFASEGARVVCAARTLNEGDHKLLSGSLSSTVAQIEKSGGKAVAVAVDVSKVEECEKLVRAAEDAFGVPDMLVNNAALTYYKTANRWKEIYEANKDVIGANPNRIKTGQVLVIPDGTK